MRERVIDGRLQIIAAISLLTFSRLVLWDTARARFAAVPRDSFESNWRREVDPVCGRLICWITFSAGAEFLAKGVCLLCDVEVRTLKGETTHFGTLGSLCGDGPRQDALKRLCASVNAEEDQQTMVLTAFKELARDIRNRDAHAYIPNVRDDHFEVVLDRFVPCFNLLVSWLPEGAHVINNWRDNAPQFISSLV